MILKDAELVLNSLQDLTVDIKHFPTRESYEFAKIRKTEAINIMIAKIKDIKYKIKAKGDWAENGYREYQIILDFEDSAS